MENTNTCTPSPGAPTSTGPARGARSWSEIEARLTAARPELQRQGAVRPKVSETGQVRFVVRYRTWTDGRWRQRSIALGTDPQIVARTRQLLSTWQAELNPYRSPDPKVRHCWMLIRHYASQLPRSLQAVCRDHFRPAILDSRLMPDIYPAWFEFLDQWQAQHGDRSAHPTRLE